MSAFGNDGPPEPHKGNGIDEYDEKVCNSCGETFKKLPAHMLTCEGNNVE